MTKLSNFKTHPVRFLSVSNNGTLCYGYDGEIYTQAAQGKPQKVKIELLTDEYVTESALSFTSGANDPVVSPDGKQVAFIVRGEVFVTCTDYETTRQITHTVAAEKGLTFAPDGRSLTYASERDGHWQLYTAKIARDEDLRFPYAMQITEEPLLPDSKKERACPKYSPDGKELAFVEDRSRLMVVNLETKAVRQVTDGKTWYNNSGSITYDWSPDGKWIAFSHTPNKHEPYYDIAIVSAQGGKVTNITQSGYSCSLNGFTHDGNAILFSSERYGMRSHGGWGSLNDVFIVYLNQEAYDKYRLSKEDNELRKEIEKKNKDAQKETKGVVVELEGIEERVVRLTPASSKLGDAKLSPDGETLYYFSTFEGGYDLWKLDLRKKETKLLHKSAGNASMQLDKDGKTLFMLGSSKLQKMDLTGTTLKTITFRAQMKMDLAAEREYMFNHVYLQEKQRFYDPKMHGVDWEAMCAAYRKFLPHINNNADFAELLSELLGELNVSHTGCIYYGASAEEPTAELGLLYDWSYTGDGLKVAEVIAKGPFAKASSKMAAGVIIERIDGVAISADADFYPLLNGKSGKKLLVSLYDPSTGDRWEEIVTATSSVTELLYPRWVKQRAADVERWSNGRLGYVHIEAMGDASFRTIYADILGKYNQCEGIIIDTRFNGGGRLHEDIEVMFSGEKYLTQVVRGRETCDMPSRRWNKPSIMLTCEANYSNAHGTPWVYKHKKLGKVVGAPVAGTMTTVTWERLQDSALVFGIPVTGYRTAEGNYLENTQLEPDIMVLNAPETVVKGEDTQLKAAVDALLKEIGKQ